MKRLSLLFLIAALAFAGCDPADMGDDNNEPPTEQNPGGEGDNTDNPDDPDNPGGDNGDNEGDNTDPAEPEEPEVEKIPDELPDLPFEYEWVIVAADGTGDYRSVAEAINKTNSAKYKIFHIRPGVYYEKIKVNKSKVILYGDNPETTILTYDDYSGRPLNSTGTSTVGTQDSASFTANAADFMAINITFENTHKNNTGSGDQAVAVAVMDDRAAFYNCRLLGYQDTFYPKNVARVYCKDCYIEGNVDFIFGDAVLLCENCTLCCNRDGSALTAPSSRPDSKFGFVFMDCTITAIEGNAFNGKPVNTIYLGRAWHYNAQAVYIRCEEPECVAPAGWMPRMSDDATEFRFAEYQCTGPGAAPERLAKRENNGRLLTDEEAAEFTRENIFSADTYSKYSTDWTPMEPFSL